MEGRDIVFIPMSGGVKEMPFWKDLAERWREKIKTLSLSDEIEPGPDDLRIRLMKEKPFLRKAEKRIIL